MPVAILRFTSTTIGQKVLMALTGFLLFFFVVVHMVGNLQLYQAGEPLNAYAELLRTSTTLLWIARLGLIGTALLHVGLAIALSVRNASARRTGYNRYTPLDSTTSSRTMIWTGLLLALFVMYHLAHLTLGWLHPYFVEGEVHQNVVIGFSQWSASAFYILAMVFLGLHMYHGVWSMFQSVGLNHVQYNRPRRVFATAITWIVVLANISMPVAVLTGLVR